jgi:phosphoglycolate phosphatase
MGFDFTQKSFDAVSTRYISEYNRRRFECQLQPFTRESLDRLSAAGLAQSVLSAYREDSLREAVANYGLAGFFSHLSGLDNIRAEGKLDRGRAHLRTLDLHEAPHTVLLIGDTAHDHEVATAIGADCLLLHHGHMHPGRLDDLGAPLVATLPEAVEHVLRG